MADHVPFDVEVEPLAAGGGNLDVGFAVVVVIDNLYTGDRLRIRNKVALPYRPAGGNFLRIQIENPVPAGDDDARSIVRRGLTDGHVIERLLLIVGRIQLSI